MTRDTSYRPYVWMLMGSAAFSCMGFLAHEVGGSLDWQVIAMVRCFIPFAIVLIMAISMGAQLAFLRPRVLWIRSIAGSISLVMTFFALTRLPVSDVFTITNIFPVWVALFSWYTTGVFPSLPVWVSVASGMTGVVLIFQPHLDTGNWAVLSAFFASLSTAVAMLGLNRLKHIDTRAVVVHFSGVAFCFAFGSYFVFQHTPIESQFPGIPNALKLLGVGVAATIGQLFLTKAFTHGDPAKVSVVGLSQVAFTLLLDIFVLHHLPEWEKLLGIPLVLAPTAWMILRERRRAAPTGDGAGVAEEGDDLVSDEPDEPNSERELTP